MRVTLDAAAVLPLEIAFSRGGTTYAVCQFRVDRFSEHARGALKVEYKIDIEARVNRGKVQYQVHAGSCDSDLSVPGFENTIPDLEKGDAVEVRTTGGAAFLDGQL